MKRICKGKSRGQGSIRIELPTSPNQSQRLKGALLYKYISFTDPEWAFGGDENVGIELIGKKARKSDGKNA